MSEPTQGKAKARRSATGAEDLAAMRAAVHDAIDRGRPCTAASHEYAKSLGVRRLSGAAWGHWASMYGEIADDPYARILGAAELAKVTYSRVLDSDGQPTTPIGKWALEHAPDDLALVIENHKAKKAGRTTEPASVKTRSGPPAPRPILIVNWNPSKWKMADDEFEKAVEATASGAVFSARWSVGLRTRGVARGDRVFLLRQGRDRGLVAEGYATGEVKPGPHWDGSDRLANYVRINWTTWLALPERLRTEVLVERVRGVLWNRLQASGTHVPDEAAPALVRLWEDHLESLGRAPTVLPDEVTGTEAFREGATTQVLVNRYERSQRARQACIDHHGTTCAVCGFDFAKVYGALGKGYIHVHHITELSLVGDDYEIDPVTDLRPVCPNCHAMLHRQRPALTVPALRKQLRNAP